MDGLYYLLVIAMILGAIDGLIKAKSGTPSFWRGFGEGMAGRGKYRGGTYFVFRDRRSGLGIGTRIDGD
ncbi:MAG: hypothetical protein ACKOEX_07090 [Planctomycetia bacterium]